MILRLRNMRTILSITGVISVAVFLVFAAQTDSASRAQIAGKLEQETSVEGGPPPIKEAEPEPTKPSEEVQPSQSASSKHAVGQSPTTVKSTDQSSLVSVPDTNITIGALHTELRHLHEEIAKLKAATGVKSYADVKFRNYKDRKRILITGGSGFVGSHLVDYLMQDGHEVVALDNHFTGRRRNLEHWFGHPNFELVHHDIVNPFFIEVDQIYHLASPASPPHYMFNPVKTIKTNTLGAMNMLGLARRTKATVLLASTSEVYGDPEVHPQPESYWGHVNPIGPRACYDEGKRVAETLMMAYHKQEQVDIRIARIFNTFGPRMHMNDGRVVSNFILQALQEQPITIYGTGNQTRSFQYVTDLVRGLVMLMNSNQTNPVNLGNPEEHTILSFANIIKGLTNSTSEIVHKPAMTDDPMQRRPDIDRAWNQLKWKPKTSMTDGLRKTIAYFQSELTHNKLRDGDMLTNDELAPPRAMIEHYFAEGQSAVGADG